MSEPFLIQRYTHVNMGRYIEEQKHTYMSVLIHTGTLINRGQ